MGFCRRESSSDASGSKSSASRKSAQHSSSSGEDSSSARSKSRSKSKERSGGSSSSKSRSSSRSRSRSPSPRRPSSRSPIKSITSPPAPGDGGKSDANKSVRSDASSRSNGSGKAKKLLRASERKASAKMEKRMSNDDSDSEDESNVGKEHVKVEKVSKKKIDEASEPTWRDEFDDGLDDDLRGNEEDVKRLDMMTEKEREEEIFKRGEKREELKKRFEISQKLKLQLKDPMMKQKSEGELSSDEEEKQVLEQTGRKKGYEVKHATKFSALSQLKAKREEKEKKDRERKSKEEKNGKKGREDSGSDSDDMRRLAKPGSGSNKRFKASETYTSSSDSGKGERRKSSSSSSSSSSVSSSGSSGESDTERHKSKKVVKKAINVTCKEDLEKIRLSRFKIDKFVHLPIFKRTVVGCFVRVSIGNNPEKNLPIYRVAEITDVCETAKVYDVMKSRTNIGLRLNHGKMSKVFRAQFISNQPFTESEFSKWKQTCLAEHVDLPTVKHVEEKLKGIQTALTYRFSSHDVDKILASKEKFAKGPKNYAMAKAKMMKDKVNAQIVGNTELVEEIDCKLAELEEKAEKLDKARTGSLSNISFINDRNRKNNVERAERGIREEQKRLKMEGKVDDPFTRRKTRPVLSMPKKEDSREMTSELLLELENERKVKEEKVLSVKVEQENPDIKKEKVATDDSDIFNAHDFDIDINIGGSESGLALNSIAVKPVTTSQSASASTQSNKRSLKLEDYKRRRGII